MSVTMLFSNYLVFDFQYSKEQRLFPKCSLEVLGESNYNPIPFTKKKSVMPES